MEMLINKVVCNLVGTGRMLTFPKICIVISSYIADHTKNLNGVILLFYSRAPHVLEEYQMRHCYCSMAPLSYWDARVTRMYQMSSKMPLKCDINGLQVSFIYCSIFHHALSAHCRVGRGYRRT